jgi:hypothetical protein
MKRFGFTEGLLSLLVVAGGTGWLSCDSATPDSTGTEPTQIGSSPCDDVDIEGQWMLTSITESYTAQTETGPVTVTETEPVPSETEFWVFADGLIHRYIQDGSSSPSTEADGESDSMGYDLEITSFNQDRCILDSASEILSYDYDLDEDGYWEKSTSRAFMEGDKLVILTSFEGCDCAASAEERFSGSVRRVFVSYDNPIPPTNGSSDSH